MERSIKRVNIGKRKACDLCHIRKIKCDSKVPKCTHCAFYEKECTYTPVNRRPKKKQKSTSLANSGNAEPAAGLHERDHVEDSIQAQKHDATNGHRIFDANPTDTFPLPPMQSILPLLDDYFLNFNTLVPIFDQKRFMKWVRDWYSDSSNHDAATWAAINIVLALSLQQCGYTSEPGPTQDVQKLVGNAQSVMNSLATRDSDLKGLQVMLGLVVVFQCTLDARPAAVLTATAVKLAHRLKLNLKQGENEMDEEVVAERRRVFWITYILDRDTSIRAREAYLQRDEDIGVDMPTQNLEETDFSTRLAPNLAFLSHRAQLARIQGKVYDLTFSVQARGVQETEKLLNDAIIDAMLDEWRAQLPDEFSEVRLLDGSWPEKPRRHLLTLHFSYLQLVFRNHLIYGHGLDWVRSLVEYSSQYSLEGYQGQSDGPMLQLPSDWHEKVAMARSCMMMFRAVNPADAALYWYLACTYTSALTILIAAKLTGTAQDPDVQVTPEQEELILEGLQFIHHMATTRDARLANIHAACAELNRRADVAKRVAVGTMGDLLETPWVPESEGFEHFGAEELNVPSSRVLDVFTQLCYKD